MQDILKSNTPAFVFDTAVLQNGLHRSERLSEKQCHFVIP